ncbi:MAG: ABC transporter ATP-binding protein [Bdellovibrionaceae bacterium]|nr:ABC transporter ATP-binding protein [Pseudobdellovibrionaceae bacterium]
MQIEVRNLSKNYVDDKGIKSVSFGISKGEMVAIIGHNGAGKSTLLKILSGWILSDSGQIKIEDVDHKNRKIFSRKVGFVPEVPNLFDFFSVEYNLKLFACLFRLPISRVDEIIEEFHLSPLRKTKVGLLSKGLKQRVSLARALLPNPSILLFDEPTSGLDIEMTKDVYRLLGNMRDAGKTVLFTSHRPEEFQSIASRIMALREGRLVFDGATAEYFRSATYKGLYMC